ncbi:acyltransferase, partial [Alphaproteobacteria bacterium]|nr:acyltransferase [Alphaproteobacteria bacterium]
AVIPVILFHAGFNLFSGGFVGVDVFFVISGYLITTIIIEDIENKSFSIINFYERRARRILPALSFVMLVCIPLAWIWMLPDQMKDFSQSLVAVSLFAANILFWRESNYFAAEAEEKPMLHTWSLAVEEQFYVLFPIFLIMSWRFGRNRVFWMIILMATLSFLLSEWGRRNFPIANFYFAPTRAWELLAGSISAFIVQKRGLKKNNPLALLGLAAIICSIFAFDDSIPFPSVYALLPVLGVVLLILYAEKETLAAKILSTKIFVSIGLISYSAYLWHQPLFAFAKISQLEQPSPKLMVILFALTLVLAYFSWRYIELYFRKKQNIDSKKIFIFSALSLLLFLNVGIIGHLKSSDLNSGKFNPLSVLYSSNLGDYIVDNARLQRESWDVLRKMSNNSKYGVTNNPFDQELWFDLSDQKRKILLVGNSHSKDMFNVLKHSESFLSNNQVARFGVQLSELDETHKFWQSKNYQAASHIVVTSRYYPNDIIALPKIIQRVLSEEKKILLIENIFEFPGKASGLTLIDKIVLQNSKLGIAELSRKINQAYYNYYKSDKNNKIMTINRELSKIANNYQIPTLNRMDYICDVDLEICDAVEENLRKNFYDYGHHTLDGSYYFSKHRRLKKFLEPLEQY